MGNYIKGQDIQPHLLQLPLSPVKLFSTSAGVMSLYIFLVYGYPSEDGIACDPATDTASKITLFGRTKVFLNKR
jgi:hypothetical protein